MVTSTLLFPGRPATVNCDSLLLHSAGVGHKKDTQQAPGRAATEECCEADSAVPGKFIWQMIYTFALDGAAWQLNWCFFCWFQSKFLRNFNNFIIVHYSC